MPQLIHPELSYTVRGVLLNVYNSLGPMLKEEFYEQAIAIGLEKRGIRCETQKQLAYRYIKHLPIEYDGQLLGEQEARLILIEDKLLLTVYALRNADETLAEQLKARMRRLDVHLGLLANFHDTRLSVMPVRLK